MRVRWMDGETSEAETPEALVREMKLDAIFEPDPTKREYMAGVAERTAQVLGEEVQFTDAASFLRELKRVGLLEVLS